MPARIAVTGAGGRLGRPLVAVLEERGHEVVPISRSTGVDVVTGDGLADALRGVQVVIDAATPPTPDQAVATAFFTASADNLHRMGAEAGVERIILVSIVGLDGFVGGYQAAKIAQERAHEAGRLPVRVLRATQFHEFIGEVMAWGRQGDVAYLPEFRTQPVAARAVAEVLADLAADPDGTSRVEVAGPRAERFADLARALAEHRGDPVRVKEIAADSDDPDAVRQAEGGSLPGPGAILAGPTYAEWLEREVAAAPVA